MSRHTLRSDPAPRKFKRSALPQAFALLALPLFSIAAGGCLFERGGGNCEEVDIALPQATSYRLNPQTAQCEPVPVNPLPTCDEYDRVKSPTLASGETLLAAPLPTEPWIACDPTCQGLSEAACINNAVCSPLYLYDYPSGGTMPVSSDRIASPRRYVACQIKPQPSPSCSTLSPTQCDARPDCERVRTSTSPSNCTGSQGCSQPLVVAIACQPKTAQPQSCETHANVQACSSDSRCVPEYMGSRCFCDANGCACVDYTYTKCNAKK